MINLNVHDDNRNSYCDNHNLYDDKHNSYDDNHNSYNIHDDKLFYVLFKSTLHSSLWDQQ